VSGAGLGEVSTAESIVAALADPQLSWLTLPPADVEVPTQLRHALDGFDAGQRPAAAAARRWLKEEALGAYPTARTRLVVAEDRVVGFYSLASAQVALSQRDRRRLGVAPVQVPAALVAWIAKDTRADIDGKALLLHAAATARRAAMLQATSVLVVDPFDEETAIMWRGHFGFRPSAEPGQRRRLWLPLQAFG
jgi:hypothetical protein